MKIVLGVTGGVAAYKSVLLLRLMTESGHDVQVVPTQAALNFVGRSTWEALSHHRVSADTFDDVEHVHHVSLGQQADLVLVAPATADFMARMAAGLAPDLLGNVILSTQAPVVIAPAMHTEMWNNPATQQNITTLRQRGVHIIDPAVGRLTGQDTGAGRLPEPAEIWDYARAVVRSVSSGGAGETVSGGGRLKGVKAVVTAGGTRESLDPVRYLGNRSSGKQGIAVAQALQLEGAEVTLIVAAVDVEVPEMAATVHVESTHQLLTAVLEESSGADVLVMAAAVADFRPASVAENKMKKTDGSGPTIVLEQTEDVLATTVSQRAAGENLPPLIVGFAAETGDEHGTVEEYAAQKLQRKGCELLVANQVGAGKVFGQDTTEISILFADGRPSVSAAGSKDDAAVAIANSVVEQMRSINRLSTDSQKSR